MNGVNITGGEPFVREDIEDIVKVLETKTERIVFRPVVISQIGSLRWQGNIRMSVIASASKGSLVK